MNKNTVLLTIGAVVLIFAFLFGAYFLTNQGGSSSTSQNTTPDKKVNAIRSDDHTKWSKAKKNLLIEYGDIQCPACKAWHGPLKVIDNSTSADDQKIKSQITFVFR